MLPANLYYVISTEFLSFMTVSFTVEKMVSHEHVNFRIQSEDATLLVSNFSCHATERTTNHFILSLSNKTAVEISAVSRSKGEKMILLQ